MFTTTLAVRVHVYFICKSTKYARPMPRNWQQLRCLSVRSSSCDKRWKCLLWFACYRIIAKITDWYVTWQAHKPIEIKQNVNTNTKSQSSILSTAIEYGIWKWAHWHYSPTPYLLLAGIHILSSYLNVFFLSCFWIMDWTRYFYIGNRLSRWRRERRTRHPLAAAATAIPSTLTKAFFLRWTKMLRSIYYNLYFFWLLRSVAVQRRICLNAMTMTML